MDFKDVFLFFSTFRSYSMLQIHATVAGSSSRENCCTDTQGE